MALRALNRPVIQRTEDLGTHQVIHPRNALKAKAAFYSDSRKPVEEEAIANAEAAIEALASQFFNWMDDHVGALLKARQRLWSLGVTDENSDAMYKAAHEVKGTGTTLGYPLASRVADSLVYLIEKIGLDTTPRMLIDKHVDAIRAIVREDARGTSDEIGSALVTRLAAVTNRYIELYQEGRAPQLES
jgi:hypothetical protein